MLTALIKQLSTHVNDFFGAIENESGGVLKPLKKIAGYRLFNKIIGSSLPFAKRNHFSVIEVKKGYVRSQIKLNGNRNHLGTMYAGALFTLAEIPGGILVLLAFDSSYVPILKRLDIEYILPAKTDIEVEFSLSEAQIIALQSALDTLGKAEFSLLGVLKDKHGAVVAKSKADYQIRRKKQK